MTKLKNEYLERIYAGWLGKIIGIKAQGNRFTVSVDGKEYISYTDSDGPYLSGCAGLSVRRGSHCACRLIRIG
jgi:hypothetical protein